MVILSGQKQIPTTISWSAIELKIDRAGNIYLAADLRNTADMDPGPGVFMMSPIGFRDAFVIKLSNDGNLSGRKNLADPEIPGHGHFLWSEVRRITFSLVDFLTTQWTLIPVPAQSI